MRGGRTQTERLIGAAQDVVLEEATTLVKDRTGLTVEVEVGRRRNETIDWGDVGERNIHNDRTSSACSKAMP